MIEYSNKSRFRRDFVADKRERIVITKFVCPECGTELDRVRNIRKSIGSPLMECPCCHAVGFYGTKKKCFREEWIIKSPLKRIAYNIHTCTFLHAIILPSFLFALDWRYYLIFAPAVFVVEVLIRYLLNLKDIEASLKRTAETEYLVELVFAGFKIYPVRYKDFDYKKIKKLIDKFFPKEEQDDEESCV